MSKKDEFKSFVAKHPELIKKINGGEMTWQKYYELYDLYGEEESVWHKYLINDNTTSSESGLNIKELTRLVKNINMDNVQKYVGNAKKAIDIIQEFSAKDVTGLAALAKGPTSTRPIDKFFED